MGPNTTIGYYQTSGRYTRADILCAVKFKTMPMGLNVHLLRDNVGTNSNIVPEDGFCDNKKVPCTTFTQGWQKPNLVGFCCKSNIGESIGIFLQPPIIKYQKFVFRVLVALYFPL